jgi:LPPG:FO 2-phospho-L-lactate transferase
VGGAKIALGLYSVLPPDTLTIIVNTADDTEHWGLHISPDLDTVSYTLAGLAGSQGWGVRDDTFTALEMMRRYDGEDWFAIGDRDLATHVFRTDALRRGATLTEVSDHIARALGVRARILPMSDDPVATRLQAQGTWLGFQEYFVHQRHAVPVSGLRYDGADTATPSPAALTTLASADAIVLANSNPTLSIMPILALPGLSKAVETASAPRIAVSPMVGANSISGPAGELMRTAGHPPTSVGVADLYRGLIDGIVIAREDSAMAGEIENMGIRALCTDTLMRDDADKRRLATEVLAFAREVG